MGGNDSINVRRPVQKTTVKPVAQKTAAKPQKNEPTFWERAKNYLRMVRDVNQQQWSDKAIAQSRLFRKT